MYIKVFTVNDNVSLVIILRGKVYHENQDIVSEQGQKSKSSTINCDCNQMKIDDFCYNYQYSSD